jgi:hypothetical protein
VKTFALKKTRSPVVSWAGASRAEWQRDKAARTKQQRTTVRMGIIEIHPQAQNFLNETHLS